MVVPNQEPKKPAKRKKSTKPNKSPQRSIPVPVPASTAALQCHQPGRGRDRRAFQHAHGLCPSRPRRQPSPAVRRQHRRSSRDRRVVEEVPHQNGRSGIHRRLLDSPVRAPGIGGLRGQAGGTGATFAVRARPKTDVLDAQWIQRLHSYGLLRASFRPPDSVLALRAYWRQRQMQVRYAASHVQHMQKALEQMNVKLTEVVSDITGLTGMSIIEAILEGERDPIKLADCGMGAVIHSEDQIALALQGTWRPEHLFAREKICKRSPVGAAGRRSAGPFLPGGAG